MASTLFDLIIMTPSSAFGTSGTIPLGSAATISGVTYLSFAGAGATGGTQVSYSILDTGNSEIGTATYTSSNTTLTSRTPTKSTNSNAAITASSAAIILAAVRGEDLNAFIVAGQLLATATNDSANAGNVGEKISANVPSGSAISLSTNVTLAITSIALTAGDWNLFGSVGFTAGATTTVTALVGSVSASSLGTVEGQRVLERYASFTPNGSFELALPTVPISLASSSIYFLTAVATFGTSVCSAFGTLTARRAR